MDFISNTEAQIKTMLHAIGASSIEELFCAIPVDLQLPKISADDGLSEFEGLQKIKKIAAKNTFDQLESYLGAGAYEHHVPALVQAICSKSEFLTAYTPYQAEISQGMLQAIFEYQSVICALTGMDASNASLYDGASACAEALLMSLRLQKPRSKILIAETLNPHYRAVVNQYLSSYPVDIVTIAMDHTGRLDEAAFLEKIDTETSAVLIQSPNFLGLIENTAAISAHAHKQGALCIQCANPLSYGIYASAGENDCDIAVGDCQPFGLNLNFGGPYAGYIACKQAHIRQLPGRIVGETVDIKGDRGFVLTLQAREQHIRREKATSNICTNQALAALAVLVTSLWYGKEGIKKWALTNFQRASYLRSELCSITKTLSSTAIFNEFTIKFSKPASEVQKFFWEHGIEPGLDLGKYFPALQDYFLIAVTETKNLAQLDRYCTIAKKMAG